MTTENKRQSFKSTIIINFDDALLLPTMACKQKSQEFLTRRALHTAVLNPVGSKTFLKKVVPMAISSILHQRVELDENDFNTRALGGIEYKVFKTKMRNSMLRQIRNWINGALDALEKNYLRELYLVIEDEENGTIHESYKFQFKYMGNDVIPLDVQMTTKRELAEATDCLFTAIQSLNVHTAFKENEIKLKMAMTYYEDVTPQDYQPPFFETETENTSVLRSLAMQPSDYLHLGVLKTGYHTVKCRAKGEAFSMNRSMSSTNITNISVNLETVEDPAPNTVEQYEDAVEIFEVQNSQPITVEEVTEPNSREALSQNGVSYETGVYSQLSDGEPFDLSDGNFQCACNISIKLNHIDTVLCSKCLTFQHCACLGYLQGDAMPNKYVCPACEKSIDDLSPSVRDKQKKISAFRLVVALAYFTEKVPQEVLKKLSKETADFVFKKLIERGIILDKNGIYKINMKEIKSRYLNALFTMSSHKKRKIIPDSMNLENVSPAKSMVLGGPTCSKKSKNK